MKITIGYHSISSKMAEIYKRKKNPIMPNTVKDVEQLELSYAARVIQIDPITWKNIWQSLPKLTICLYFTQWFHSNPSCCSMSATPFLLLCVKYLSLYSVWFIAQVLESDCLPSYSSSTFLAVWLWVSYLTSCISCWQNG